MQAQDLPITQLLDGAKQFIVPIFQRDYSWGTRQCAQLWQDILRAGKSEDAKGHFLGSVVYIAAGENQAAIPRWLLIDGQQRITTLTLIIAAFRDRLKQISQTQSIDDEQSELPTPEELEDYYLRNRHGKGERRTKLRLRRADQEGLSAIVEGLAFPPACSEKIVENFQFFTELAVNVDPLVLYNGIKKLIVVDVSLTRGQDDPQMIFESLNSTGLDLTQADLIRNFVLMRLDDETQTAFYETYWRPIELSFGARYRTEFDKFVRDFLILKTRPSAPIKSDEIYHEFRQFFFKATASQPVNELLMELQQYSKYYAAFSLGKEAEDALRIPFTRLRGLVEVASPVVMTLYDLYSFKKSLCRSEFIESIELLESFIFRRSVCDMQTRSLGQIFANLAYRISESAPLESLKVALYRQGRKRRFPSDIEFREALETRDVYDMRSCFYLLDRIENFSKERIDTSAFSIEHVLPQNKELRPEWKQMLGPNWKTVQETWLHRLGNLTLTGYNSSYSDRPFDEKKAIEKGFNESPLRLNRFIKEQTVWTASEIEHRGKLLSEKAIEVWPPLLVNMKSVKEAELKGYVENAARYKVYDIEMDEQAKALFEEIRKFCIGLGGEVVELATEKSITYRVYDFFVEVIPRRRRLTLLLNLNYEDIIDPSGKAKNAYESAFIVHSTESGGVIFSLEEDSELAAAEALIKQSYLLVAE